MKVNQQYRQVVIRVKQRNKKQRVRFTLFSNKSILIIGSFSLFFGFSLFFEHIDKLILMIVSLSLVSLNLLKKSGVHSYVYSKEHVAL